MEMVEDSYLKKNYYTIQPTVQFDPSSFLGYWFALGVGTITTIVLLVITVSNPPVKASYIMIVLAPLVATLLIFRRFIQYVYTRRRLSRGGQETTAEVVNREVRAHPGFRFGRYKDYGDHLVLDVKFQGEVYPIYIHNHRIFSDGGVDIEGARVGSKLKVSYDSQNPQRFIIAGYEDGTSLRYVYPPRSLFYVVVLPSAAVIALVTVILLSRI